MTWALGSWQRGGSCSPTENLVWPRMCAVCRRVRAERVTVWSTHTLPWPPHRPAGGQGARGGERPLTGAGGWAVWGGMPGLWLRASWERAQKKAWAAARWRHSNAAPRTGLLTPAAPPPPACSPLGAQGLQASRGYASWPRPPLGLPLNHGWGRSLWRRRFLTRKWRGVCSVSSTQQVGAQQSKFPPCVLEGLCPACKSWGSPCCWGDYRPCESL